jgi:hypothetical protein
MTAKIIKNYLFRHWPTTDTLYGASNAMLYGFSALSSAIAFNEQFRRFIMPCGAD